MQTILAAEAPPGGIKSLVPLGCRTASGLRMQRDEIKYKKPTVSSFTKRAQQLSNCGSRATK